MPSSWSQGAFIEPRTEDPASVTTGTSDAGRVMLVAGIMRSSRIRPSALPPTAATRASTFASLNPTDPMRTSKPCRLAARSMRSEEHTSELQSRGHLVCRLLLEKKKPVTPDHHAYSKQIYYD